MMNHRQAASPIAHSAAAGLAENLRQTTLARLNRAMLDPNPVQNIAAAGAPAPQVVVSNPATAAIEKFNPLPGQRLPLYMSLRVTNAPGPRVDNVADALQRYLNIGPRHEPTADPKNEATHLRHPQQILSARKNWDDIFPYQFSLNGVSRYQQQPVFHMVGGSIRARVSQVGAASIAAPATQSAPAGDIGLTAKPYVTYPPAFAAQMAMEKLQNLLEQPAPTVSPADNLPQPDSAWQNAVQTMRASLQGSSAMDRAVLVGPLAREYPLGDPATAASRAIQTMRVLETYRSPVVTGAFAFSA